MRALIIAASLALAGCSSLNPMNWLTPHRLDIPQGNYVTEDAVARLKPGMTRSQVRFVLGTPLLTDPFHANRWDYKYRLIRDGKVVRDATVTVFFEGDVLTRIEGQPLPAEQPVAPPLDASAPAAVPAQ
ncbi:MULTISPECIES: outer membrane protein assembly factor BamE [Gulbenkiania]|uniref:Outer membrane protein assembly factor BamE n=2 Tax=Gulbenkiania TaxID=397456 RepID=A0A0K6GU76_9NEIS|nr:MULTISPECIES: outer membrane protein assembly factor BamE [Gulbenkiania]TCW33971.1 outer membrane protein assembly factor BamE [Gulbenkiania mobilis]CUA82340.1 Beta-barrel assembly machine subunit BamE [Gulbenkiania indica]